MGQLNNKTALITGSSSGIGKAMATKFAQEGANVIITYHSGKERAEQLEKELSSLNVKVKAYQVDVSDLEQIKSFFALVEKDFNDIDILVNNAGVNGQNINVEDMDIETWDNTIKTDLYGPFYCIKEFLKLKKKHDSYQNSRIINVTSIHEYICKPGNADYNASKAGMRNLSQTLAIELAPKGLTVNNIAPGMILTPMNKKVMDDKDVLKEKENIIPMKRGGSPEEVANVALFLASQASSYVTGSTYTVDGALSILGQDA
ncbi:SDR family NAD(P)-dependent oxidoreductase [Apibacter sp. HY039]|uniref:SDR family NAD(P)-dependent oxidoreductase n=1 Tax=Apibacter sp. HY039 TaxID=2501476 RepID=UPI000FEBAE2A|nr:SDR family oxidoreductase [Apibacter sp. HY039]